MSGFNDNGFLNWEQWKIFHASNLEHPVDFEKKFVDTVLSRLHNVEPSDVVPQYHFIDSKGGNRYIDFVIINESKGFNLAIELDGLTKIQNAWDKSLDYDRYNDMMIRQNDLLRLANVESLLRFTNKQMLNQTTWVINEINQELQKQAFNTARMREQQSQRELELREYQNQIAQLKQENDSLKETKENKESAIQDLEHKSEIVVDTSPSYLIMPTVTDKDVDAWRRKKEIELAEAHTKKREEQKLKNSRLFKKVLALLVLVSVGIVTWNYVSTSLDFGSMGIYSADNSTTSYDYPSESYESIDENESDDFTVAPSVGIDSPFNNSQDAKPVERVVIKPRAVETVKVQPIETKEIKVVDTSSYTSTNANNLALAISNHVMNTSVDKPVETKNISTEKDDVISHQESINQQDNTVMTERGIREFADEGRQDRE